MEELSSYELERRENMRQNFRRLVSLGLADDADDPDRQAQTQPRRAPAKRPRPSARRSRRAAAPVDAQAERGGGVVGSGQR